jgi:hypothetical protein
LHLFLLLLAVAAAEEAAALLGFLVAPAVAVVVIMFMAPAVLEQQDKVTPAAGHKVQGQAPQLLIQAAAVAVVLEV